MGCSRKRLTDSESTRACRINLYAAARHCFVDLSARHGITLDVRVRTLVSRIRKRAYAWISSSALSSYRTRRFRCNILVSFDIVSIR